MFLFCRCAQITVSSKFERWIRNELSEMVPFSAWKNILCITFHELIADPVWTIFAHSKCSTFLCSHFFFFFWMYFQWLVTPIDFFFSLQSSPVLWYILSLKEINCLKTCYRSAESAGITGPAAGWIWAPAGTAGADWARQRLPAGSPERRASQPDQTARHLSGSGLCPFIKFIVFKSHLRIP